MTDAMDRAKTLAAYWGIPWHQVEITAHVTGLSHYAAMDLIAEIGAAPITGADLSALQQPIPLKTGTSATQPKQGPTRCRNCNQPISRYCRKCAGSYNIKTQGRTRK